MCLRQTRKVLCLAIVLSFLMAVVAPSLTAQPAGSPTSYQISEPADSRSVITLLLDWLSGWVSDSSEELISPKDPKTGDPTEGGDKPNGEEPDGEGGSGMDPLG